MVFKWREMSSKKRRNIVLGVLIGIMIIMAVGYAAFSTQLRISGTSNISSKFAVLITNIESKDVVGTASNATDPTYTATTATFSTNLVSPGDSITYKITVANQGTIDATLSSIDVNTGSNDAIVFEASGLEEGDNLLHGTSDDLIVKVSYSDNVTSQPENTTSTITVTLNYEQATGGTTPPVTETAADKLKKLAVTEGDGLYVDEYEEGRYIYKGTNPNNYITFNNEEWRIMSVENDGTIKIIRNQTVEKKAWDETGGTYGSKDWTRPATLNTYLNGEYLNGITTNKDKIVSHNWGIGAVEKNNNDLAAQIAVENGKTWNGKIALMTVSEYLRANTNKEQCGTISLYNYKAICLKTNWMFNIVPSSSYLWTLSTNASDSSQVFFVSGESSISTDYAVSDISFAPVLYLNSDIVLTGDGSKENPYVIN